MVHPIDALHSFRQEKKKLKKKNTTRYSLLLIARRMNDSDDSDDHAYYTTPSFAGNPLVVGRMQIFGNTRSILMFSHRGEEGSALRLGKAPL